MVLTNTTMWKALNMMIPTHTNPKISSNIYLHAMHNLNRLPMAPPGTLAIIYESTETRASWALHGAKGWYVGFLPDHYRCFDIWCSNTKRIWQVETGRFFPHDNLITRLSPHKTATCEKQELKVALRHPQPSPTITLFGIYQQNTLQKLDKNF